MTDPSPILNALLTRRSVRVGYEDRPVGRELLEQIIACGEAAPSSKNAQPWRFHAVADRSLLVRMATLVSTAKGVDSYVPRDPRTGQPYPHYTSSVLDSAAALRTVSAAVLVENLGAFSGGRNTLSEAPKAALAGSLVGYGFELIGIGAAVENMWIAANALGLSASFMGDVVIAEPQIQKLLAFDGDLMGVLVLGYSTATPGSSWIPRAFESSARTVWHP